MENVLGEESKGVYVLMSGLDIERGLVALGENFIFQGAIYSGTCISLFIPFTGFLM